LRGKGRKSSIGEGLAVKRGKKGKVFLSCGKWAHDGRKKKRKKKKGIGGREKRPTIKIG